MIIQVGSYITIYLQLNVLQDQFLKITEPITSARYDSKTVNKINAIVSESAKLIRGNPVIEDLFFEGKDKKQRKEFILNTMYEPHQYKSYMTSFLPKLEKFINELR